MVNVCFVSLIAELDAAGFKQKDLVERLGVTRQTISNLANGHVLDPLHSTGKGIEVLHSYHVKGEKS